MMSKLNKILIMIAVIILGLVIVLAGYNYFTTPQTKISQTEKVTDDTPRQELFSQYFTSLKLAKPTFNLTEAPKVEWQLTPDAPSGAKIVLKVVNVRRGIFISETSPIDPQTFDVSSFGNPRVAGEYELWVYLFDQTGSQNLISVIPFFIQSE